MKTELNFKKLIACGQIKNELELEQALVMDRKLRLMAKENPIYKTTRRELRSIIEAYENKSWAPNKSISANQLIESDKAEIIAEEERLFIEKRKTLIRDKIKALNISQQQLGLLLGHRSKSYMSELMNGLCPFTLKDLVIINKLLKIKLTDLIPTFLSPTELQSIKSAMRSINNDLLPNLEVD